MSIAVVVWIEIFVTLALRWLVLNEQLDRTIRGRPIHGYLGYDELSDLLSNDPKGFARSAPREWLKGLRARTETSPDPVVEHHRTRGNRGYVVMVAYLFLGTPLVLASIGILGRASSVLLAATFLAVQGLILTYWLWRLRIARRRPESGDLTSTVAVTGICAVLVCAAIGAALLTSMI